MIYGQNNEPLAENSNEGFQRTDITTAGILDGNNSYFYALKHPLLFIYGTSPLYDWYTNNQIYQNNTMWGNKIDKSVSDPCPNGWKIPETDTWGDFTTITSPYHMQGFPNISGERDATNGICYNKITWYPSCGYRYYNTGLLGGVGGSGCYWSATSNEIYAKNLYFHMTDNSYNRSSNRANGRSVRCVQE